MTKPVLAVTQSDGSRKYVHPLTGEAVPSVTTVLKKGLPKQDWMVPWAVRMAADHARENWVHLSKLPRWQYIEELKSAHENYAEEKADIGDIVHDILDCWSTGKPYPDTPKEINGFVNNFIYFLVEKRPRFIENEVTLWSREYNYAGTADFIAQIDGAIILGDLKTGKRLHDEIGLQLSALAHCDFILRPDGTEEPLPQIDGLAGLHLRPRSWKLVEIHESDACFDAFLAAKKIMDWTLNTAPKVLS